MTDIRERYPLVRTSMAPVVNRCFLFVLMFSVLFQVACNRVAKPIPNTKVLYTGALIQKYKLTVDDLKALQFYLAGPATLTRQVTRDYKVGNAMGKLVERDGVMLEEIRIPADTPGVCIDAKQERYGLLNLGDRQVLYISFHNGTSFSFAPENDYEVSWPMKIDANGNASFFESESEAGNWKSTNYHVNSVASNTRLMVDEDSLRKVEKKQRTLEGVKLPGSK